MELEAIDEAEGRELIVPVRITETDDRPRGIVARIQLRSSAGRTPSSAAIGGMQVEGLSIADVVELARRLS